MITFRKWKVPSVAFELRAVGMEGLARGQWNQGVGGRGKGRRSDVGVRLGVGGWFDLIVPEDGSYFRI